VSVSAPFIHRPIATSLLAAGMLLLGLLGLRTLPIASLPTIDFPIIQVTTSLPGASPEIMATSVTAPLERQLGYIPGLLSISSTSSFGNSAITLKFALTRNIDGAAQDVQAAIIAASGQLPQNLPSPPIYSKVNPADSPIMLLAIVSQTLPLPELNDIAETMLVQKLSRVEGIGEVAIDGGQRRAVRIQVDPDAIAALGLSLEDVRNAIDQANVAGPKGDLDGSHRSYAIAANAQLFTAGAYRDIIIAERSGAPVRLRDIGSANDSVENSRAASWLNQQPAILLNIKRQPGANVVDTVDRLRALLPHLQAALPPTVQLSVLTDRTEAIRASINYVQFTLLLSIALVVIVIFIFLRKLRATAIPAAALPLSLVGTFGVMALCGFSLDNISLMALTVAAGFVVDDAIVMIENIARHIEAGEAPIQAALKGSKQIGFTVISLTLSLIAAFIPLLFMGSVVGRLFREFAITLSAAVLISAVVSLTLTPMLCAYLLQSQKDQSEGRLSVLAKRVLDVIHQNYERSLRWVLRHQRLTLTAAILTLVASIHLYSLIPKGFLPEQDTGLIPGVTEAAQDISFSAMLERQRIISAIASRDPDVAGVGSLVGSSAAGSTLNVGRLYIALKPRNQRSSGADEVMARLREKVALVPGITLFMQTAQDIQLDGHLTRSQYQYVLQDTNIPELTSWAPRLVLALRQRPELRDVASNQQTQGRQLSLTIYRDQAARLDVSPKAIAETLYDAFGQRQISTISTQLNQYRIILEVEPRFRESYSNLSSIHVKSKSGEQVPLRALADFETETAPLSITRVNLFPSVILSFNLAPGFSLGQALSAVAATERQIGLPESVVTSFSGQAAEFSSSLGQEPMLIIAAIVVIYIVLGVLYESYIHPITILSTLPSAGVGALLALMLFGYDLSIISLIGLVLLIGIVKKNAILMIDFALAEERMHGTDPTQAIIKACLVRFRPIMMTTLAALFGCLPLALEVGTGSELRRPMGIAIVGGLLVSQFLTLYTTPVIYLALRLASETVFASRHAGNALPVSAALEPSVLRREVAE
jgi:multidrug efflux pump